MVTTDTKGLAAACLLTMMRKPVVRLAGKRRGRIALTQARSRRSASRPCQSLT